eukprot:GEMP01017311.1.p1 GENE.GEMP01017311.1~~GEMP01017311.1.p1  ORF type:complete len:468 (+),score=70.31 GEMP01017311.1:730-2133(+)
MCDVVLAIEELCLENIDHHWLGVLLEIALFGYAFIGLALMCDKFLVPALETLCLKWNISEDLAGATFMAFGSGAPEVILSTLVTLRSVTNESLHISERHGIHRTSGLGVSTILGSAWIAYLLIPACCTFLAKRDIYVNHGGLVRDMSFYLMALVFLYNFGFDRTFNFSENIAMILGYCLYTLVVVVQSMWQRRRVEVLSREPPQRICADEVSLTLSDLSSSPSVKSKPGCCIRSRNSQESMLSELSEPMESLAVYEEACDDKFGNVVVVEPGSKGVLAVIVKPLEWVFQKTVYADIAVGARHEKYFFRTMMISFLWVSVFSWIITVVISRWIKLTSLSSGVFGVSLVAFGGQIPDAIQSVAAAKKGHGSMALSNALGSQNLNIFLGLGIPWLFCTMSDFGGIELTNTANLYLVGKITFCVVIVFLLFTLVPSLTKPHVTITRTAGIFFLLAYLCIIVGYSTFTITAG